MWLSLDRMEGEWVVLLSDDEQTYTLTTADYEAIIGRPPQESDILSATVRDGRIVAASVDDEETARRKESARARLDRLFGRHS